jgi:4-diphosphocytidyl-2-C-methyl-D-erythritol kinase
MQTAWGSPLLQLPAAALVNDLEETSTELLPDVGVAVRAGKTAGALASLMAGSGSTCAFLARDKSHARSLAMKLQEESIFREVALVVGPVEGFRVLT